jgi:signal peptidase I
VGWSINLLFWALVACAAATIVLAVAPGITQRQLYAVRGGSMEPAFAAGDAILVKPLSDPGRQVVTGDVVITRAANGETTQAHRIIEVRSDGSGGAMFLTAGDANLAPDAAWTTSASVQAKVVMAFPGLGHALRLLAEPLARLLLFVLPVVYLAGRELIDGLYPEEGDASAPEAS